VGNESSRMRLSIRMAALLRYMQGRRYSIELRVLARGLGVCERTIRRDLEALEAAGFSLPRWRDARDS
jgi:predicted DNA-binding transcriptional regulator YafY